MKEKAWKLVDHCLAQRIPVMLLYVLESLGSSPGRQGFFMVVTAGGQTEGSIGGGIMEHKFVEMAREKLLTLTDISSTASIKKQFHDKAAIRDQSGMICSGEQTIFLYPVKPTDAGVIQNIIQSLAQPKNGTLQLSPSGINFSNEIPQQDFYFHLRTQEDWEYKEKTGWKNQLFIIGGGHCALALSKLMYFMDFYIRLYDDRPGLKTIEENKFVHESLQIPDLSLLKDIIPEGANHYVVIMTVGYRNDDLAIRALVNKNFKYIGLLGSQAKINTMFDQYRLEQIDPDWLASIHAPLGLAIKSQTPEEIAVSIAAEIIQIKNRDL